MVTQIEASIFGPPKRLQVDKVLVAPPWNKQFAIEGDLEEPPPCIFGLETS